MEVIRGKINCDPATNIPLYKSGEWIGNLPSHWNTSRKMVRPIIKEQNYTGERSNSGRKHFDAKRYSAEVSIIPSIRLFPKMPNFNFVERSLDKMSKGLRHIKPCYSEPITHDRKVFPNNKITIRPDVNHGMKHFNDRYKDNSSEYYIENSMGGKQRMDDLAAMRNGMKNISPGDKIYKNVEYSPGYFQMEGIVVGSTNTLHYEKSTTKRSDNFYETLDLNVKTLNPNNLWTHKLAQESLDFDNQYLKNMVLWEENYLSPYLPGKNENISNIKNPTIITAKKSADVGKAKTNIK